MEEGRRKEKGKANGRIGEWQKEKKRSIVRRQDGIVAVKRKN